MKYNSWIVAIKILILVLVIIGFGLLCLPTNEPLMSVQTPRENNVDQFRLPTGNEVDLEMSNRVIEASQGCASSGWEPGDTN